MTTADVVAIKLQLQNIEQTLAGLRKVAQETRNVGQSAESTARSGISQLRSGIDGLTASFTSLVTAALGAKNAIDRFESARNYKRMLEFQFGPAAAQRVDSQTTAYANRYGFNLQDVRGGMGRLAGTGELSADQLIPTLSAFMAMAKVSGADANQAGRAFYQYTQVASQGRLQGDELRTIQDNNVQIRMVLKQAGLGHRIKDTANPLTFKEINEALLKWADQPKVKGLMEQYSKDPSAAFARFSNQVNEKIWRPLGDNLAPAATNAANKLSEFTSNLGELQGALIGTFAVLAGAGLAGKMAGGILGRMAGGAAGSAAAGAVGAAASGGLGAGGAAAAGAGGAAAAGAAAKARLGARAAKAGGKALQGIFGTSARAGGLALGASETLAAGVLAGLGVVTLLDYLSGKPMDEYFLNELDPVEGASRQRKDELEVMRLKILKRRAALRQQRAVDEATGRRMPVASSQRPIGRHTVQNRVASEMALAR